VQKLFKDRKYVEGVVTAITGWPILAAEAADVAIATSAPQGAWNCAKLGDCSGLVNNK
jgi:hypothetical protein